MRSDLLEAISSARGVTNAVILTHNIDFVFVQTVVLSAFRRCGNPTITVFADSSCAAGSFAQQKDVLDGLGVRYRVVPVEMGPGSRFHPKAILLSGEQGGTLLVGSGNLTFGGWRENGEIWTRFESGTDGPGPFHAFRGYLDEVLKRVALPGTVQREVEEAFDPNRKSWFSTGAADERALIGRVGSGPTLLDQMLVAGGEDTVDELIACTPYFDNDGIALQELVAGVGAPRATVLCQAGRTALHERAWKPNAASATLQGIDFAHAEDDGRERGAFVHAKFYGLRRANEVVVLAGSANCSRAALTARGNAGNAELMAVRVVSPQEFERDFLGDLELSSEPIVLPSEPHDEPDEDASGTSLRILAARFDGGTLLVGFAPSSAMVCECLVDEKTAAFQAAEKGVVSVSWSSEPKLVTLRAWLDGELAESAPAWIDLERQLRTTAHSRSLVKSLRERVQPGAWSADGWAEVLEVFCKHLSYMPAVRPGIAVPRAEGEVAPAGREFTVDDVFAPDYRVPKLDSLWLSSGAGRDGQVHSLQQLLLRWFGVETSGPEEEVGIDDENDNSDGPEEVDRPEPLPTPPSPELAPTERNRRRIARIVGQIEAAMTSSDFLSERSPDYLATDLKVAAALLCVGLGKGWIERERFFELTHRIWSSLFFVRDGGKEGWLEYRAKSSEHRRAFIRAMTSAELSAALIGWYLAAVGPGTGSPNGSPAAARFSLAAALAVARLPWLWCGGSQEEISKELAVLLAHMADGGLDHQEGTDWAEGQWGRLNQRGQALCCLETAVRSTSLEAIRARIRIDELPPGEVLWQGNAGFCVVLQGRSRSGKYKVPVLKLQGDSGETAFRAGATVPIRALLDEHVIPLTPEFGDGPRLVLAEFIRELSRNTLGQL